MNYFNIIRTFISSILLVVPTIASMGPSNAVYAHQMKTTNLILAQNMPQLESEIKGSTVELHALHSNQNGAYTEVSKGLLWISSNKNVASVNQEGVVTLAGHNGRTFIVVTDGKALDRIAIQINHGKATFIKQHDNKYNLIQEAISSMSVEEKVGQMLMPDFRNWNGKPVTEMNDEIREQVKKYHLGGVILFRENVVTTEQMVRLVDAYKKANEKYGILLSIDQEGGIVTRLQSGTDFPGNMALGATRSTDLAQSVGKSIVSNLIR